MVEDGLKCEEKKKTVGPDPESSPQHSQEEPDELGSSCQ